MTNPARTRYAAVQYGGEAYVETLEEAMAHLRAAYVNGVSLFVRFMDLTQEEYDALPVFGPQTPDARQP